MNQARVAIFASGSGSTAEAFIREVRARHYPIDIKLLVCNNPRAFVIQRVKNLNEELGLTIRTAVVNARTQPTAKPAERGHQTDEEQEAILDALRENDVHLVILLGYMKLIGPELLTAYGWLPGYTSVYQARMLNTHPGLLPETVGTHGQETQVFVLKQGFHEAGQSLHVVSSEYDSGPIVAEHRVTVMADDTPETLFARVQAEEKKHIAADIMEFIMRQSEYRQNQHAPSGS